MAAAAIRLSGFPAVVSVTLPGSITAVTEPVKEQLNQRQLVDYRSQREDCLEWLLAFGKNPDRADGYAETTVAQRAYRMSQFYRWIWQQEGHYTADVTHTHADQYYQTWRDYLAQFVLVPDIPAVSRLFGRWLVALHVDLTAGPFRATPRSAAREAVSTVSSRSRPTSRGRRPGYGGSAPKFHPFLRVAPV